MRWVGCSLSRPITSVKDQLRDPFQCGYAFKAISDGRPGCASVPLVSLRVTGLTDPAWRIRNHPARSIPIGLARAVTTGVCKLIVRRFVPRIDLVYLGLRGIGRNYRRQLQRVCKTLQDVIVASLRMIDARIRSEEHTSELQ